MFAIRWEKGNKSGYMPAYFYDPYRFRVHKMNGGTFQNYPDKTYLKLTGEQITKHLAGEQLIGIYPLLPDNTSWFINADFDEGNWIASSLKFIQACKEISIPAYLERSRSGNGGHVWIFFETPIPACKSRKVVLSLLTTSGAISAFDKNTSFDRLFPNQDYHSGKGLGNLIALPLHMPSLEKGNSCFIDINTLEPYTNQEQFLREIQKVTEKHFDTMFSNTTDDKQPQNYDYGKLIITLKNNILLNRSSVNTALRTFLKEELNFLNTELIIKKNSGKNTFNTNRYFRFIEEEGNKIYIPKGFAGKLIRFCRESKIDYTLVDNRKLHPPIPFSFHATLRDFQLEILQNTASKQMGVIVAPSGSGKTVIALKMVAEKQQPALIVVHRSNLLNNGQKGLRLF